VYGVRTVTASSGICSYFNTGALLSSVSNASPSNLNRCVRTIKYGWDWQKKKKEKEKKTEREQTPSSTGRKHRLSKQRIFHMSLD
jgi:hypothetical protein